MAGGGANTGFRLGATDEFGWFAEEDTVQVHDLHAMSFALLGLDHERMTYHHTGRHHRLADICG
jgi:hypothetical protein